MGYPECLRPGGFNDQPYPWFENGPEADFQWVGMDFGVLSGTQVGCDVACYPCSNDDASSFNSSVGSHAHGSRFLRPDPGDESRSASGRYDWPTGDARVIYIPFNGGRYQLAMCFKQLLGPLGVFRPLENREYWDEDVCSCIKPGLTPGPGRCIPPGNDIGCVVSPHRAATVFVHTASDWPPNATSEMFCTGQFGFGGGVERLRFDPFVDDSPSIIRLAHTIGGSLNSRQSGGCAIHKNAKCSGRQHESSACLLDFGAGGPQPLQEVLADGTKIKWNYLHIKEYKARFRMNPGAPESQRAITDAKNRVIQWMDMRKADMPLRLGVVDDPDCVGEDCCETTQDIPQNIDKPTSDLIVHHDFWSSEWNGRIGPPCTEPQPLHSLAEYATEMDAGTGDGGLQWDNCYLRRSGQRVRVRYVPIQIVVHVTAQWLSWHKDEPCQGEVTPLERGNINPLIRVSIDVQMGVWAEFLEEDGSTNLDLHTLANDLSPVIHGLPQHSVGYTIVNDESRGTAGRDWNGAGRYPEVRVPGLDGPLGLLDEIVFVDNAGRTLDGPPPDHWTWLGEMHLARDKTAMFDQAWMDSTTFPTGCCAIYLRMANGLPVHAAYSDPTWPETYDGSGVRIRQAPGSTEQHEELFRTSHAKGYVTVASNCQSFQGGCGECDGVGPDAPNPDEPPCGGENQPPCS